MKGSTTHITCIYCKSTQSIELYKTNDVYGNEYGIQQCKDCNCNFLSPFPSEELLDLAYQNEYYGHGTDKFRADWIERLLDYFRGKRADRIHRLINGQGRVLDLGCGNGRFLDFIQKRGDYEIHGVEISTAAAKRAQRVPNLNLIVGKLISSTYPEQSFNAVTLFHVFEHLDEPKKTLDVIDAVLKPNGVAAFSFPNISSWQAKLFKGAWFHMDAPRHLSFFNPKDFISNMENRGYELVDERHFNIEYNPYGTMQSILNLFTNKREVLYEHLKSDKSYVAEYSKINLFLQGAFFRLTTPLFVLVDAIEALFKKSGTVELIFRKKSS